MKRQGRRGQDHAAAALLRRARVGRLATAGRTGVPHVIPVCFVFDGRRIYSAIDEKPKRTAPLRLRRVRNIVANPRAALVVDEYDEDWSRLRYVLVRGTAAVIDRGREHARAVALLRQKYPQYRRMRLEERPVLRITPRRLVAWAARARGQRAKGKPRGRGRSRGQRGRSARRGRSAEAGR